MEVRIDRSHSLLDCCVYGGGFVRNVQWMIAQGEGTQRKRIMMKMKVQIYCRYIPTLSILLHKLHSEGFYAVAKASPTSQKHSQVLPVGEISYPGLTTKERRPLDISTPSSWIGGTKQDSVSPSHHEAA